MIYRDSGALPMGHPSYVERACDQELFDTLIELEYCYVFAPRQTGKTSLLRTTTARLEQTNVKVVDASVQAAAGTTSEAQWYIGMIDQLVRSAKNRGYEIEFDDFQELWDAPHLSRLPIGQRFITFITDELLRGSEENWVIAIDEIDSTIGLDFTVLPGI